MLKSNVKKTSLSIGGTLPQTHLCQKVVHIWRILIDNWVHLFEPRANQNRFDNANYSNCVKQKLPYLYKGILVV